MIPWYTDSLIIKENFVIKRNNPLGFSQRLVIRRNYLSHWGRLTHMCVDKLTIISSDNAFKLTFTVIEILIQIHTFLFKKMHLTMSSAKWWSFCLGINVQHLVLGSCIWTSYPSSLAVHGFAVKGVNHYDGVIMGAMASQITGPAIVYSTVYSAANQRKHQSSASLAFVREIHWGPVNFPHNGQ